MLLSLLSRSIADLGRHTCARLVASGLALAAVAGNMSLLAPAAHASDLDAVALAGATEEDGHFLRLGTSKSAVVKLPAEARDVVVGDPLIVDVVIRNKNTAYLFGRKNGQTNVFFFDADGRQIMQIDLEVTTDTKALQKLINRTFPANKIKVDTVGANVVLNGTAANAAEAKLAEELAMRFLDADCACKVVNALAISEGDQVMLKVRVVEVQRDVAKQLGVALAGSFSIGDVVGSVTAFNPVTSMAGIFGGASGYSGGSASYTGSDFSVDAAIEAMEREGVLRTLAEPTLTAISGQPAMFHAGGEFDAGSACTGASGSSNNGTGTFTGGSCGPMFKPYGVTLGFTPMVLSEGRISLKIATAISELDAANSTTFSRALTTRNAETTVELPSGGSMMLAGLIKDVSAQSVQGTPGLKNLPVLGALFRSRDFLNKQTEMVVIVTPYIVNATAEKQLATPMDHFNEPTDRQTLLWGRLNKVYGTPGQHPNGVYHGTVGYIIE